MLLNNPLDLSQFTHIVSAWIVSQFYRVKIEHAFLIGLKDVRMGRRMIIWKDDKLIAFMS
jgi:hypothetical protein